MGMLNTLFRRLLRPPAADAAAAAVAAGWSPGDAGAVLDWVARGMPAPPPHVVKQTVVRDHAARFGTRVMVETGTYFGAMVEAMRDDFGHIYSIELSRPLHDRAVARFRGDTHITLIHGDSGQALQGVLAALTQPALFWLDGHWSDGVTARGKSNTPVREELAAIFGAAELAHVVLIDDAREFGRDPDYPGLEELHRFVQSRRPDYAFSVDADIIRILPRG
jgi:hypothetical protein